MLQIKIDTICEYEKYYKIIEAIESEILTMYPSGTDLIEVTNKGFEILCSKFEVYHRIIDLKLCKIYDRTYDRTCYHLHSEDQVEKTKSNPRYEILD